MKLPKILIAGSNVVDLIFHGKVFDKRKEKNRLSLAFGGKYVPQNFYQMFGGGGANASISMVKQGFNVMLWSYVGNDAFGRQVVKNLKKNNVKTDLIKYKAKQTALSCILLTSSGERTIINYRSNADEIQLNMTVRRQFKKRQWFAFFSLAKCPKDTKIQILREAKKNDLKVFLSLHGSEYFKGYNYLKNYFTFTDILHINAHELADIFGGNAPDFDFHKTNFAQKLKLPLLIVTYDLKGSFAYTKNNIYFQPIIKTKKVVDTTGAGDAFAAGFLGEYIKTDSIKKSLYFGAKNASSVIEHLGAQNGFLSKGV